MKSLSTFLLAFLLMFSFHVNAQETKSKSSNTSRQKETKVSTVKSTTKAGPTKKDGTPDRRYKANKKVKKDGTPDKRFKENKSK